MESKELSLIIAYIQPFLLEPVVDALRLLPEFPGLSVTDARGFGRHGARPPQEGERGEVSPLGERARIEILCRRVDVMPIVQTVHRAAHTGNPGDGKILVIDVSWAGQIRTNKTGTAALLC